MLHNDISYLRNKRPSNTIKAIETATPSPHISMLAHVLGNISITEMGVDFADAATSPEAHFHNIDMGIRLI